MPKMKTHSSSKKRFRRTGTGKMKRSKAYRRHHAWAKNAKNTRQLRESASFAPGDEKKINRLLPN